MCSWCVSSHRNTGYFPGRTMVTVDCQEILLRGERLGFRLSVVKGIHLLESKVVVTGRIPKPVLVKMRAGDKLRLGDVTRGNLVYDGSDLGHLMGHLAQYVFVEVSHQLRPLSSNPSLSLALGKLTYGSY